MRDGIPCIGRCSNRGLGDFADSRHKKCPKKGVVDFMPSLVRKAVSLTSGLPGKEFAKYLAGFRAECFALNALERPDRFFQQCLQVFTDPQSIWNQSA
jgi:hypothetical protein